MSTVVEELFSRLGIIVDEKAWDHANERTEKLKDHLKEIAVAFIGIEGIKSIYEMVQGVSELAVHAEETGKVLGITAEAVQQLGFAAKISGVSQEELEISLTHLARGMQELAKGEGPAADAFQKLHISAKQLKGESLDQNLELIATRFAAMPDGATKTALAMDLFGRSGARLIPLLDKGQKGIVALRNEASSLGIVIGDETAAKFKEFESSQTRLSATWQGLKIQVVTALLPALQGLVDRFQAWVTANRELIAAGLEAVVSGMATVFSALGSVIEVVADAVQFFVDNSELGKSVITALGVVLAAFAAEAVIAWAVATGPIALMIAGITAVIFAIRKLVANWDAVQAAMRRAGERILQTFRSVWEAIKTGISSAWNFIANLPVIKQLVWLVEKLEHLASRGVKGTIRDEIDDVGNALRRAGRLPPAPGGTGPSAPAAPAPSRDIGTGPTASNTIIRDNTIKIDVSGAESPTETASTIKGHLDDYFGTLLLQTREVVG